METVASTVQSAYWNVDAHSPLDNFHGLTLPVSEYLALLADSESRQVEPGEPSFYEDHADALARYHSAHHAAIGAGMDVEDLVYEQVGYDPNCDRSFFIFKVSNNGTTYIVTEKM